MLSGGVCDSSGRRLRHGASSLRANIAVINLDLETMKIKGAG